jgi:hypothetical protein
MPATLTGRTWAGTTGNPAELHAVAQHIGAGAVYLSDVLRAVLEELGDFAWRPVAGDYPNKWLAIDFDHGCGSVRVFAPDVECRQATVLVLDRRGGEAGRAAFTNLSEDLVAAVVVAELVAR